MKINKPQSLGTFLISLFFAMILKITSWPDFFSQINPDWVLLLLIYWALTAPQKTGIICAWNVGLVTDVLTGRLLGQYGLAYPIAIYFCLKNQKRLHRIPLLQQGLFILFVQGLAQLLIFWTENFHNSIQFSSKFWLPVISGTFIWPFFYALLHQIHTPGKRTN